MDKQLTDRAKAFRAAIAGFIGNKLKKAPKDDVGNYAAATNDECSAWIANAVANIGDARIATHPIRMIHSSIKGATSIYTPPPQLLERSEIGTHSVAHAYTADFAIGNSPQVPGCQLLLQCSFEGHCLADWIMAGDGDLSAALDVGTNRNIATDLAGTLIPSRSLASSKLAKQVYWLVGDESQDDSQYHLLQPMFSSTLEDALYQPLSRFKDAYFNARGTQKKQPTLADHSTYPNLVRRNIGGANPQNVSPLNSMRHGDNYLLASLPPRWKQSEARQPKRTADVWAQFEYSGKVRGLLKALVDLLKPKNKLDPKPIMETRQAREVIEQELGVQLAIFSAAIHARFEPGWSRAADCELGLPEKLWLDPEHVALPLREGFEDEDADFNAAWAWNDWPDAIAGHFAQWLNGKLRDAGMVAVGDSEAKHWAKQAIVEAEWPLPMQLQMPAGDAA